MNDGTVTLADLIQVRAVNTGGRLIPNKPFSCCCLFLNRTVQKLEAI